MKKIVLVSLLFLAACGGEYYVNKIEYFVDKRTNLCFAFAKNDPRTMTYVPCTVEVMSLIKE